MDKKISNTEFDKNNSVSIFRPDNFLLAQLHTNLSKILPKKEQEKEYVVTLTQDLLEIQTDFIYKKKTKKSLHLYSISQLHNFFRITIRKVKLDENGVETIEDTPISIKKDNIIDSIYIYVNELLGASENFEDKNQNEFITDLNLKYKNHILYILSPNEFILICLPITNVESKDNVLNTQENENYFFIQTTDRRLILAIDKYMSIEVFNIDEEIFTYKEMIGKDRIFNPQFSFYTEFFNDKLFHVAQDIITKKQKEPIPIFADILVLKNNASKKQIGYLKKLYTSKNNNQERTVCLLKSELITRFPKRKFIEENSNNDIIFQFISNHKDFSTYLLKVIEDWQIKLEEQVQFLNFLLVNTEHYNYYHISDFYTHIFKSQTNTKKDKDLNFRLGYINYLKKTKQYYIAMPIYEELIYQVEEDNLLDIISDSKINIIGGEHSNQLRIQLLEDLAKIKVELKTSNDDELLKLAILQPLTTRRIDNLKTATKTVLKQKAEVLCSTLSIVSLNSEHKIPTKLSAETYEKENLFELVVPECFKKKQGFLQTLTNLIAQIAPPDYSDVLQFSEKVTESNHPTLYKILKETAKILSITNIECFFGRGNYSSEIIGVEGTTNFLIVGCDYLDEKNIKYLSYKELQFLISIELSHILFEHTRLTSKDIWRGAKNKSLNLAQVLLIALPVLGTLGNVIGKYANISYLGKMINGIDRINNVVEKGQTAIEYSGKVSTIISKKEEKEKNLLATSRLMEISADRVGLLITKDIKSCLTAILKSDSDFEQIKEFIEKKGVLTFLKQQNEELEYLNQSYIIRLKMLFNFYLTNDMI